MVIIINNYNNKRTSLIVILIIVNIISIIFISNEMRLVSNNNDNMSMTSSINYNFTTKSICVMDINSYEVLYEQNMYASLPPASLTKILTCIVSILTYNLDDYHLVTNDDILVDGSRMYLNQGDLLSIKDLLYGLMLVSGNDCAKALANHYSGNTDDFIYLMNELLNKLNLTHSIFYNPHGLDDESTNITCAYDLAYLYSYAYRNNTFKKVVSTKYYNIVSYDNNKYYLRNKHRLITSSLASGGKTGIYSF